MREEKDYRRWKEDGRQEKRKWEKRVKRGREMLMQTVGLEKNERRWKIELREEKMGEDWKKMGREQVGEEKRKEEIMLMQRAAHEKYIKKEKFGDKDGRTEVVEGRDGKKTKQIEERQIKKKNWKC